MSDPYDMIDRFLRNNLGDGDYAEYSQALDEVAQADEVYRMHALYNGARASLQEAWDALTHYKAESAKCGGDNCMGRKIDGHTTWVTEAARDAAVAAERERWIGGVRIQIPTDAMEQEIQSHVRLAVNAERERCARICELFQIGAALGTDAIVDSTCRGLAAAIRSAAT